MDWATLPFMVWAAAFRVDTARAHVAARGAQAHVVSRRVLRNHCVRGRGALTFVARSAVTWPTPTWWPI